MVVPTCCPGWTGVDCEEPPPRPPIDPLEPCKGQTCEGSDDAVCMTVTKCGRSQPVFYDIDGPEIKISRCRNGQPVDVEDLLCSPACAVKDPCRGLKCPAHPDAVCTVSECDCDPMWLVLETGVEVDCASGEALPPKSERRRRRSLQENGTNNDVNGGTSSTSGNCTQSNLST